MSGSSGDEDRSVEELRLIGKERGWSDETIAKVVAAKVPLSELRMWAWMLPEDRVEAQIGWHERLRHGDLRGRQATMGDNEGFAALWSVVETNCHGGQRPASIAVSPARCSRQAGAR